MMRTFVFVLLVFFSVQLGAFGRPRAPRAAIVVAGPADEYRQAVQQLATEVTALMKTQYPKYTFPDQPTLVGDFSKKQARVLLRRALSDPAFDIVVCFGFQVGQAVGQLKRFSKPVFLPFAAPKLQGLPRKGKRSGRKNLSYLTGLINLEREFRRFRDVIRRPQAAVLVDQVIYDSVPNIEALVAKSVKGTMKTRLIPVQATAKEIIAAIPADTQSVYLGPLIRLPHSEIQPLIDGLNDKKLPTYASEGRSWVERGAFTSLVPADERARRMRRVAINIVETLNGEKPERFSTAFEPRPQLVINMTTARKLGLWPRFELMTEAELVDEAPGDRGSPLSLRQAVKTALERNLDLRVRRADALIAEAEVGEAWGSFLPQISATGSANWIDSDVASSVQNAERELSYEVSGQQLIYGPQADRGIRARKANLRSVEASVYAAELDTVLDAATAYLNVLRARTSEHINRENLKLSRQNLALAEVRVEVGTAGRQEVFRWQNEIADSRASVIAASANRNQSEIALNRVLNQSLEQSFTTVEPMGDPSGIVLDPRVSKLVEDPWSFKMFREFMVREGLRNAPELKQLRESMMAQHHQLVGQKQALYIPDLALNGGFSHVVHRNGVGATTQDTSSLGFPARDDFTWRVGGALTFRVFDGTRYPRIEQSRQALRQLETQLKSVSQGIEQQIRSAIHQTGASNAAVKLRKEAAEAAGQNLELVIDAYRQGTVDIVTLIDAQNQALLTKLAAANSVYDFLLDFVGVERASGRFGLLMSEEERDAFAGRLKSFVTQEADTPHRK